MALSREEIHERFKKRLIESEKFRQKAADWVERSGYELEPLEKMRVAPHYSQAKKYADSGDIYFRHKGRRYRMEVKARYSCKWTIRHNFPYTWHSIHQVYKWKKLQPKPYITLIYHKTLPADPILIWTESFPRWRIATITDRERKYPETQYWVHLDDCRFVSQKEDLELFPVEYPVSEGAHRDAAWKNSKKRGMTEPVAMVHI